MSTDDVVSNKPAFKLKGSSFTLTALQLINPDLQQIEKELLVKVQQAPKFFDNTPVVIDLQSLTSDARRMDLTQLITILQKYQLLPIGLKGGSPQHQTVAAQLGLVILPESTDRGLAQEEPRKASVTTKTTAKTAVKSNGTASKEVKKSSTLVINQPIRSGQQIYAQGGDLIVLSSVSVGAELLADGHIHVYGPLRGRALAGVMGDSGARIFCHSLEAELVSVSGNYKISEHLKEMQHWKKSVMIYLEEERLQIVEL